MNWPLLAGSLAGVLALSGMAWLLRLGRTPALTPARAAEEVARLNLGQPGESYLSSDGNSALVACSDGLALVRRHGAHWVARPLARPVNWRIEGEAIRIETPERAFGPTRLTLPPERREALLTIM